MAKALGKQSMRLRMVDPCVQKRGGTWSRSFRDHSAAMVNIVVPISAADAQGVITLARHAHAAGANLVEIRLDSCVANGADPKTVIAAIPQLALPAILTIRHRSENGDHAISDEDRDNYYHEAMRKGVAWIDC